MESDDLGRPFDAGTYGRSFADVYDDWYPNDNTTRASVERIASLVSVGGTILELGVGTGRLALPLADLGYDVVGLDSSPEMLDRLEQKLVTIGAGRRVQGILGDVSDPDAWPKGTFDAIVAAYNLIFNLGEPDAQRRMFSAAADAMSTNSKLVVETSIPAPAEVVDEIGNGEPSVTNRHLEVKEVTGDSVVLIATESHPDSQTVVGQHIELRNCEPARLRPWRIRFAHPAEMDTWATAAGLELMTRDADWSGSEFDPHGASQVSIYRRKQT